jgi:hypothetical protein
MGFKSLVGILVAILGIASLVFGIIFIIQAGSATQEISDSLAPVKISEVDAKYDAVAVAQKATATAEEPKIQGKTAAPSDTYNYLSAQRALLALARTNVGLAQFIRMMGIVNVVIGAGLFLVGWVVMKKA